MFLEGLQRLAQEEPVSLLVIATAVTVVLVLRLYRINQRLQRKYDEKAD